MPSKNLLHRLQERQLTGRILHTLEMDINASLRRVFAEKKEIMGGGRRNMILKKVKKEHPIRNSESANQYATRIFNAYKREYDTALRMRL